MSSININITEFLLEEVLSRQIPAIQTFLLKTSILDRYCASLCEAVIGKSDANWGSRACLDLIERAEMFIIPQDSNREWYRYHHLFQDLLQHRQKAEVGPEQVADMLLC